MPRFAQRLTLPEVQKRLVERLSYGSTDEDFHLHRGVYNDPTMPKFSWERFLHAAHHLPTLQNIISKDLAKVRFSWENTGTMDPPHGPFVLINGVPMLFAWAGGDWEWPVTFFLYVDPKGGIRGYLPKEGNRYNHAMKTAYGNDEDSDDIDLQQRYGTTDWDFEVTAAEVRAMIADASARIQVK